MLPEYATLTISQLGDEVEVVLVPSYRAAMVRARDGYHEMDSRLAKWMLAGTDRWGWSCLREFVREARLAISPSDNTGRRRLRALVEGALADGRLVALCRLEHGANRDHLHAATAGQRQLVKFIEALTRGRLSRWGRQYKLVVRADLVGLHERDTYDVVCPAEALGILDAIAAESTLDLGLLLAQARDKLAGNGRSPSTSHGGLVLLRRAIRPRDVSVMREPMIPPAQMKKLLARSRSAQPR